MPGAVKMLRTIQATRYVTPLREGGSLPAIIEADDQGLYVLKFRGAGQGPKALAAELIAAQLAAALQLPVPEVVLAELDPALGRNEPDAEIRDLLLRSQGQNIAMDYLPGSLMFDPATRHTVEPELASRIVWFDSFITNIDRTPRNPNLLRWHKQLYLIDHGAALYFHHDWPRDLARTAQARFPASAQHVLLPWATELAAANLWARTTLTEAHFIEAVTQVPPAWLAAEPQHYVAYFNERLAHSDGFTEEAESAHANLL
jgi:hypothetical protein